LCHFTPINAHRTEVAVVKSGIHPEPLFCVFARQSILATCDSVDQMESELHKGG
jgi:hypothetical protein